MLLSMPLVFSNLPHALEGGKTGQCLMQLMPVFLGMIPGLLLGVRVLPAVDANAARTIAGLVLMGVGGIRVTGRSTVICDAARIGKVDDSKILVLALESAKRVRTRETGESAL